MLGIHPINCSHLFISVASAKMVLNEIGPPMLWSLIGYVLASMNLSFVWIIHLTIILSLKKLDYEVSKIKNFKVFSSTCS